MIEPRPTNTLALIGFVSAFIHPLVGMALGVVAARQIARTQEGGRGFARAAIVVGGIGTVIGIVVLVVWLPMFVGYLT